MSDHHSSETDPSDDGDDDDFGRSSDPAPLARRFALAGRPSVWQAVTAVIVAVALACPVLVVTGTIRKVPLLGWIIGPPKLFPTTPIDVGLDATYLTVAPGGQGMAVWIARVSDGRLLSVADNGSVTDVAAIPDTPAEIVADDGGVWFVAGGDIIRFDARREVSTKAGPLTDDSEDFAWFGVDQVSMGDKSLWAIDDYKVLTVGREGIVTMRTVIPSDETIRNLQILAGSNSAWVVTEETYDVVIREVTDTGEVSEVARLPGTALQSYDQVWLANGTIWMATRDKAKNHYGVVTVDTDSGKIRTVRSGEDICSNGVRAGGDDIWLRCGARFELIDEDGHVRAKADVYDKLMTVVDWTPAANGDLWVLTQDGADNSVLLHIVAPSRPGRNGRNGRSSPPTRSRLRPRSPRPIWGRAVPTRQPSSPPVVCRRRPPREPPRQHPPPPNPPGTFSSSQRLPVRHQPRPVLHR